MFLGLAWLLVAHARDARARAAQAPTATRVALIALAVAADLAVTAAVVALSMLASGFGLTWVGALATSGQLTTGIAPASMLANAVAALARVTGAHVSTASGSALLAACRAVALGTAAVCASVLLWRAWRRADPLPPDRPRTPAEGARDGLTVLGVGGFAVALGSPVIYPWYLAPALPMLAALVAAWLPAEDGPGTPDPARRRRRVTVGAVMASSVWLCLATMSPLGNTWPLLAPDGPAGPWPLAGTLTVAAGLVIIGAVATARASRRRAAR
jgi:hypothetical protein